MVTRYGGRQEPTMHCFMPHCAHPPPPPLSQFRIISAANTGRPDVGFHVPGASYTQQQGGGAGPPNAQLRAIPHPHHGGNPQQPPPQSQAQHTGGPPGPAPTSTPPGPTEMGKQGPPHMQGQPQMQQGGQVPIGFVPNQTRAPNSQTYFAPQRGPAPRIPNHRNAVVNMQPTNVGQQMFPQHVPVPMYNQQIMTNQLQPHVFVQPQLFSGQARHQNHTGGAFYQQGHQQVMMPSAALYQGYQHATQQAQYYYQSAVVSIPRPGGGVTGAPGPGGLATAANQQVIAGGAPPAQLGQPGGPVTMSLVQGVGVPGLTASETAVGQTPTSMTTGKQTRRKHALDIVDPKTMKNVDIYEGSGTSSSTPPHSGESSARDTPQPNTGPGNLDVAAEFAARVAKVASEKSSPPPPLPSSTPAYLESPPTTNGPDPVGVDTNSIPMPEGMPPGSEALSPSKQQIVVIEENISVMAPTAWKQGSSIGSKPSGNSSKSDIIDEKVAVELEPATIVEFVPSVSATAESTPVVSAQTNAPTVEVVRSTREPFPALKSSAPAQQSPRRKQRSEIAVPPSIQPTLPSVSRETTPTTEVKAAKKPASTEETISPTNTFPVSQPVKEKRDQEKSHGRDREKSSSVSSQGRGEREKSVSSTSSSSSTGREREKSSRDKDKGKDRDKSASQGRDKSSMKEPAPVLPQPQVELPPPSDEPKQQANGEMTVVDSTDGKASQRSKPKPRNQKMRDLNRKGAEKEGGTDMDAFVEPSPEETAPPTSPTVPQNPQPVAPAVVLPSKDNQIVKEEEEEEETEIDKEERLVAARNEENAKVSAAALKEDISSTSTPVIESIPPTKPTTLILRHTYKEDQWSPMNPEGKKKYEREFLMELMNDPQSKKKPDNLPDIEVVLKDNSNRRMADRTFPNMNRAVPDRSPHDNFTPGFMRMQNSRGPVAKRNSQQGKPKGNKPNVIHLSLSLKEDVKLRETENAWKPSCLKDGGANEQEAKTEELFKKVRGVLNKLTPQKFDTLVSQVQSLPIDTSERLQGVINLVFEKAVDEPSFSVAYANMCKVLTPIQVPKDDKNSDDVISFRKLLVNRCQAEFEKNSEVELNREAKLKEILEETDPEKKKELQLNFEEEERRIRMKSVGNIRFIGELFKQGMLTTSVMQRCIKHLISEGDEESLECLCKLLTTIGKDLESKKQDLTPYFMKMKEISHKRGEVSSRVRFMLQDVIDLRMNKWVPRRDDSNPKTMDQIQKEAEKEVIDQQILNSAPPTPRRQDDRPPSNRKNRGGVMGGEDSWNTVSTTNRARYSVDTSKLKAPKEDSISTFGSHNLFSQWSHGAKGKDQSKKPTAVGGNSSYANFYAVLDSDDGKRPSPPMSSTRLGPSKTTPSPSMEKERMLQPFKSAEGDSRQSRGGASRSSSRDKSVKGGGEEPSALRSYAPSSQPPSISASSEDISNSAVKSSTAPVPSLSLEEVQKKALNLLDEFLYNNDYSESESLVQETFPPDSHSMFVRESLNEMLERTSAARLQVGKLMSHLVKNGTISLGSYLSGLTEFLEAADDIAIDVPKFWPYTAEFIVPMLSSETLTFADLRDVAQPSTQGTLLLAILELLVTDKGPGWIREKWEASGVKWTDFIPADQVENFIKQKKLEYIQGGAASAPSASSTVALNWDHVQQKLEQFLKPEQASTSSFDQVCEWISANVGDRVKEPQFIRALMTAICCSSIDSQKTTLKLNETHFQHEQKLVLKYVDNNDKLELQCLYAVQSLINQLEHPQGLLCQIFQALWDDGTISNETFMAWETSNDPAEQAGKGVALKSLTTFFTALREGDDESSCEEL